MTTITDVRPYLCLDDLDRLIVADRVKNFMRYVKYVRQRNPLPAPPIATLPPPQPEPPPAVPPRLYAPSPRAEHGMLPFEVAAWLRKHKSGFGLRHIANGIGRNESGVRHALNRMVASGEVIKYREGEKKVYFKLAEMHQSGEVQS